MIVLEGLSYARWILGFVSLFDGFFVYIEGILILSTWARKYRLSLYIVSCDLAVSFTQAMPCVNLADEERIKQTLGGRTKQQQTVPRPDNFRDDSLHTRHHSFSKFMKYTLVANQNAFTHFETSHRGRRLRNAHRSTLPYHRQWPNLSCLHPPRHSRRVCAT